MQVICREMPADYSRTPFPDQCVTMNECQRQWITAMLT
jgi:hypothetical protein